MDGTTYPLESPFMVIATQNPVEMEGTYPLPEAQRDRFTARISIGYPTAAAELEMLDTHGSSSPLDQLKPVATATDVRALILAVRGVLVIGAGQAVHHRAGQRDAARHRSCGSARRRVPRCTCCGPAAPGRPWPAATTSSPTTSRRWRSPCSRTGCCPTTEAIYDGRLPEQVVTRLIATCHCHAREP